MNIPDLINGLFEFCGSLAAWWNVRALWKDKHFSGVRIAPTLFFTSWTVWNLYYYPHLGQWISFFAGTCIGFGNLSYLILMLKYRNNKKEERT
jgi:hypothetical protein